MQKGMSIICIVGMCAASMASAMNLSVALSAEHAIEGKVLVVSQPGEGLDPVVSEVTQQEMIALICPYQLEKLEVGIFDVGKLQASLVDNQNPVLPNSATRHPAVLGVQSPISAQQKNIKVAYSASRIDKPGGHLRL